MRGPLGEFVAELRSGVPSKLVTTLATHGCEAVAASPASGVNTDTSEGLADVLEGTAVVVDVSNSTTFKGVAALEFFETSTCNLLRYEAAARVGHHVALSVVGTERLSKAATSARNSLRSS